MSNQEIRKAIDSLINGYFSNGDRELFRPIFDSLMNPDDQYMLMKDFESYIECQGRVSNAYKDQHLWNRKSILNVARMGKFSSDRTIREYAREIWGIDVP